ncbi:DUF2244 domain-containing protein [Octadecabacter sp. 1_MG-2023]|uniref:DUF2244 domain-containing protein n=1 Tax=unclassified Octadecabacter TaxID=196158 RepID=UPI001C09BF6A|nr:MULTISPECIES: DUF2244 domain-containing protein [unclassified Octadecabacter]MBU2993877.1 DUF2244 domain-containing protein [Octadecabacter sp. B2R22]MDO6735277.1 DUF2244 domain-containing protein [Octadecabacter sp. 1_MG-2023]
MPVEWITPQGKPDEDAPLKQVHLWPYRSLLRRDFVIFIAGTLALVLLPMLSVLGSPVLWGLLPFFIIAVAGMWYALHRSYKDGEILEDLSIWHDRMTLDHHDPRKGHYSWEANPYWVQVKIDPHNERIPNYLTLKGNDREVEIGTFLSEDERAVLYDEITDAIRDVLNAGQT